MIELKRVNPCVTEKFGCSGKLIPSSSLVAERERGLLISSIRGIVASPSGVVNLRRTDKLLATVTRWSTATTIGMVRLSSGKRESCPAGKEMETPATGSKTEGEIERSAPEVFTTVTDAESSCTRRLGV